jgi:hypothetical protein
MPKRIGRPTVRRDEDEKVPLSTRIRGKLYNQLIDAAIAHGDRSLGSEVEMRLEQSFNPILPDEHRNLMMTLGALYLSGGPAAVLSALLTTIGNPSPEEQVRLYERLGGVLERHNPYKPVSRKSGFIAAAAEPAAVTENITGQAPERFRKIGSDDEEER